MKKIAGKVTDIDFFFTEEYLADMPYYLFITNYISKYFSALIDVCF